MRRRRSRRGREDARSGRTAWCPSSRTTRASAGAGALRGAKSFDPELATGLGALGPALRAVHGLPRGQRRRRKRQAHRSGPAVLDAVVRTGTISARNSPRCVGRNTWPTAALRFGQTRRGPPLWALCARPLARTRSSCPGNPAISAFQSVATVGAPAPLRRREQPQRAHRLPRRPQSDRCRASGCSRPARRSRRDASRSSLSRIRTASHDSASGRCDS